VATHQRLTGRQVKDRVVQVGQLVVRTVVGLLAVTLVGITVFVSDLVVDRTVAWVAGGVALVALVLLLVVLPERLRRLG